MGHLGKKVTHKDAKDKDKKKVEPGGIQRTTQKL
jgi:hypothetical protein